MKKEKSLTELIIELEEVNRTLDKIKNDPSYIEEKVKQVFGDKKHTQQIDISTLF